MGDAQPYAGGQPYVGGGGPTQPQAGPPPKNLEGRWEAADGSYWELTGQGPQYRLTGGSAMGVTDHGVAHHRGNIVVFSSENFMLGRYQLQLEVRGEDMSGMINVMGFPVPMRLHRVSWPQRRRTLEPSLQERFASHMTAAEEAQAGGDLQTAQAEYLAALEVAMQSPEPEDDIQALQHIMLLAQSVDLSAETVQRCDECVLALVKEGHQGDAVAQCLALTATVSQAKDIDEGMLEALAAAGGKVLHGPVAPEIRLPLAWASVRIWLRLGRADEAAALLEGLDRRDLDAGQRLQVAALESDIQIAADDRAGAIDGLTQALRANEGAPTDSRLELIQKILAAWPPERQGVEPWVEELRTAADDKPEPMRSLIYLQVAAAMGKGGALDGARTILRHVDMERVRAEVPPALAEMLELTLQQTKQALGEAQP